MWAITKWAGYGILGFGGFYALYHTQAIPVDQYKPPVEPVREAFPRRKDLLNELRQGTRDNPFDLLIIGGGATGTGIALDATTRGLRTALIERDDFGSGTSSRSTKLVHGGVRYLEKAVFNFDQDQLKLVFEALQERSNILKIAPHLTKSLPIMTPCYQLWEVPFYWAGLKAYDLVALYGTMFNTLALSRYVSASESIRQFPTLARAKSSGESLKGSIVYYDGQLDDSRLNVTLATTSVIHGATAVNHAEATNIVKNQDGKAVAVQVRDKINGGRPFDVYAKKIVNATGPFTDSVRYMSDASRTPIIKPSSGVHVTLPEYYSPDNLGMIVPKSKDGRVVFMLPWEGQTVAGTTDSSSEITELPKPTGKEVGFILESIADYLTVSVRAGDVQSAWSGIRPLAVLPPAPAVEVQEQNSEAKEQNSEANEQSTETQEQMPVSKEQTVESQQQLQSQQKEVKTADSSRDHVILEEDEGMLTIAGGKWTTYRKMAEDVVDMIVQQQQSEDKKFKPCVTNKLRLVGGDKFHPALFTEIAQNYTVPHRPGYIAPDVARHLTRAYGDRAFAVTKLAMEKGLGHRLVQWHTVIEAEVVYAVREEMCETAKDFLARRSRLAFLDVNAAEAALPRVVELMAQELRWNKRRQRKELLETVQFLDSFRVVPEIKKAKE
eukprot:TRINITY_DN5218_c0_g3_i1.p1 TRINITY_DN5218_c0_g3~~TRINITY_DN5218_c0_g3_i1.p1  ORF type:complete len:683 (-),score=94.91 TRINITY_DN5218_c0_g3_i1:228-2222(-)